MIDIEEIYPYTNFLWSSFRISHVFKLSKTNFAHEKNEKNCQSKSKLLLLAKCTMVFCYIIQSNYHRSIHILTLFQLDTISIKLYNPKKKKKLLNILKFLNKAQFSQYLSFEKLISEFVKFCFCLFIYFLTLKLDKI